MKIFSINNSILNFPKKLIPILTAVSFSVPLKCGNSTIKNLDRVSNTIVSVVNKPNLKDLEGLKIIKSVNFKGGVSYQFDSKSVEILKERIKKPDKLITYTAPIENANNVYLEPFGMYFADRPNENTNKMRPHLGLDIFVSKFSRKPEKPVIVKSPLDGVVISHKRARKEDNVISNSIIMLGVDGRKYAFDHLARSTDYNDSIPLPVVGTILKKGDKIGYVGSTGETTMWHLHLIVMTEEQLAKQQKSKFWQRLSKSSGYCKLTGQVNPLDEKSAGPIAKILNKYRINK